MKNIGIVTYYNVHNHGAILQLYALVKTLEKLGYEAHAVKFQRNYDFYEEGISKKYDISLKSIPYYCHYLCEKGLSQTIFNFNKRRFLNCFKKKYHLGTEGTEFDQLIVGSDEVFSIESGLTDAFRGKGFSYKKLISYAASAGTTDEKFIKDHSAVEWFSEAMNAFDAISVRDANTFNLVKSFGDDTCNPVMVCDPVILYDFSNELEEIADKSTVNPYILVYSYDNNMNSHSEVDAIRVFAQKKGLHVVSAGFFHKWCDKNINCDPLQLVKLFANAEYVITDTFHGAVMSLITNSQFVAKIRGNGNKLRFLLDQYDCTDRIVTEVSFDNVLQHGIDYRQVNNLLDDMRKKSLNWLKESIT